MEEEDARAMFAWLASLVEHPFSDDDCAPNVPGAPQCDEGLAS